MKAVPTYADILKQLSELSPEQLSKPALVSICDSYGDETVCPIELNTNRFNRPDEEYLLFDNERSEYRINFTSDIPDPATYEGRLHAKYIVEVRSFAKDDVIFFFNGMDEDVDEEIASMSQQ